MRGKYSPTVTAADGFLYDQEGYDYYQNLRNAPNFRSGL